MDVVCFDAIVKGHAPGHAFSASAEEIRALMSMGVALVPADQVDKETLAELRMRPIGAVPVRIDREELFPTVIEAPPLLAGEVEKADKAEKPDKAEKKS